MAASDEESKERYMEAYREEKRKVKMCIYQSKKKVKEQLNEDVNGNRKLFWKEMSNVSKGERTEFKNYKGISLLSAVGKI